MLNSSLPARPHTASSITPRPPSSGSRLHYGRRKIKETDSQMLWRDNSIATATRKSKQEDEYFKKSQKKLDKVSLDFNNEVKKLKHCQDKLAKLQQKMAHTALQKYSVFLIQALYRGHTARKYYKRLRSGRFLAQYLTRRYVWKKRKHAASKIRQFYKRIMFFYKLRRFHILTRNAVIIQFNYRLHFKFKRAVLRRYTLTMWNHVKLFAICRAKNVLLPTEKHKRIVFRAMTRFYTKMRKRRLLNYTRAFKLFYGIFFAENPTTKRYIASRASSVLHKRSGSILPGGLSYNAKQQHHYQLDQSAITQSFQNNKIINSIKNVDKYISTKATNDVLHYLRTHVISQQQKLNKINIKLKSSALQGKNISEGLPSPFRRSEARMSSPIKVMEFTKKKFHDEIKFDPSVTPRPSSSSTDTRSASHAEIINFSKITTSSPLMMQPFPTITEGSRVKSSVSSSLAAAAAPVLLPTFDDVFQDFIEPKKLLKHRSTSQLDPNSMFANLKLNGTDKLVPFELRGNFRLKTIADIVFLLQDLSELALKNSLMLQNPFNRKLPMKVTYETSPDMTRRFIPTVIPFQGKFEHKISRRGGFSYDMSSSIVFDKLIDRKLSSSKRAQLRHHILQCSVIICQQIHSDRGVYLNPMRMKQPKPPPRDVATIEQIFFKKYTENEQKEKDEVSYKLMLKSQQRDVKKRQVLLKSKPLINIREKQAFVRSKILEIRQEILQQEEIIGILREDEEEEGSEDSDSDDGSVSATVSAHSSKSTPNESKVNRRRLDKDSSDEDDNFNDNNNGKSDRQASHAFRGNAPTRPDRTPSSFSFQRRRNISLLEVDTPGRRV